VVGRPLSTTVLITGGAGLLAVNWAVAIRERHRVVLGLHHRSVSISGVEALTMDLESIDSVMRSIESVGASMVVHTASLTSVERCESNPELARHVNVTLSANVAGACSKADIPLIHVSTDHLFSGNMPFVGEAELPAPVNVYGSTKAEAEVRVLEANPGALVIRTNFYGWGPSYRQSFSDVIIQGARGGRTLTLFNDVTYTPILIEHAVEAAHELCGLGASGVFNVVGDERLSKYQFGLKVADAFNLSRDHIKPGALSDQVDLVRRPVDMSLSNQKVRLRLARPLGTMEQHLARLRDQEKEDSSAEVRAL
jgi:dTDP-4-dehydrorhamnose reductase